MARKRSQDQSQESALRRASQPDNRKSEAIEGASEGQKGGC